MSEVDDILAHYGVKGMKWGVRRASGPVSSDAAAVRTSKVTIKKSGTQALSNKELQAVVTRMNLENQYKNLKKGQSLSKRVDEGSKTAKGLLKTGKTLKEAYTWGAPILAAMMAAGYVAKQSGGYSTNVYRVAKPAGAVAGRTVRAITSR